ncbi:MAG: isoprenylcysteine carboxylmethyltransferase family protein [Culturomica sp.]|jgi:protein-S-isoprenylcysteine O-methyltransferase Ste14|nr:isoprenylcysteine carboxylmethyltransferase family protein [Culturomica sp.]
MALKDEFERQGNWLFCNRSWLPLILLTLLVVFYAARIMFQDYIEIPEPDDSWELICLIISLTGLVVRIFTIGLAAKRTSGRDTEGQIADSLNTKGIYSIVRHPLYLGNFLMWLGLAMMTMDIEFVAIFILLYWLYYERIMFAEEQFLHRKFGKVYEEWAASTPAFIPAFRKFKKADTSFNWRKVLRNEKNGFCALMLLFAVLHVANSLTWHEMDIDEEWIFAAGASILVYIVLKVLKKSSLLSDPV